MLARQEAILLHREPGLRRPADHAGPRAVEEMLLTRVWPRRDPQHDPHASLRAASPWSGTIHPQYSTRGCGRTRRKARGNEPEDGPGSSRSAPEPLRGELSEP